MPIRKRFGQHFLKDHSIIQKLVSTIEPVHSDKMVEIGPGHGAITDLLIRRLDHLHVIEIDRDLATELSLRFNAEKLTVHQADVLKFDFSSLSDMGKVRIVGNLPYNITTPLLFKLLNLQLPIRDMHFMMQLEVVDRICATPSTKDYGRLSVMCQLLCDVDRLFTVPPEAFHPPPKVHSAIIRLAPRQAPLIDQQQITMASSFMASVFSQRRKTVRNAMKSYLDVTTLESLDIDPGLRPENVSVASYARCINLLSRGHR